MYRFHIRLNIVGFPRKELVLTICRRLARFSTNIFFCLLAICSPCSNNLFDNIRDDRSAQFQAIYKVILKLMTLKIILFYSKLFVVFDSRVRGEQTSKRFCPCLFALFVVRFARN